MRILRAYPGNPLELLAWSARLLASDPFVSGFAAVSNSSPNGFVSEAYSRPRHARSKTIRAWESLSKVTSNLPGGKLWRSFLNLSNPFHWRARFYFDFWGEVELLSIAGIRFKYNPLFTEGFQRFQPTFEEILLVLCSRHGGRIELHLNQFDPLAYPAKGEGPISALRWFNCKLSLMWLPFAGRPGFDKSGRRLPLRLFDKHVNPTFTPGLLDKEKENEPTPSKQTKAEIGCLDLKAAYNTPQTLGFCETSEHTEGHDGWIELPSNLYFSSLSEPEPACPSNFSLSFMERTSGLEAALSGFSKSSREQEATVKLSETETESLGFRAKEDQALLFSDEAKRDTPYSHLATLLYEAVFKLQVDSLTELHQTDRSDLSQNSSLLRREDWLVEERASNPPYDFPLEGAIRNPSSPNPDRDESAPPFSIYPNFTASETENLCENLWDEKQAQGNIFQHDSDILPLNQNDATPPRTVDDLSKPESHLLGALLQKILPTPDHLNHLETCFWREQEVPGPGEAGWVNFPPPDRRMTQSEKVAPWRPERQASLQPFQLPYGPPKAIDIQVWADQRLKAYLESHYDPAFIKEAFFSGCAEKNLLMKMLSFKYYYKQFPKSVPHKLVNVKPEKTFYSLLEFYGTEVVTHEPPEEQHRRMFLSLLNFALSKYNKDAIRSLFTLQHQPAPRAKVGKKPHNEFNDTLLRYMIRNRETELLKSTLEILNTLCLDHESIEMIFRIRKEQEEKYPTLLTYAASSEYAIKYKPLFKRFRPGTFKHIFHILLDFLMKTAQGREALLGLCAVRNDSHCNLIHDIIGTNQLDLLELLFDAMHQCPLTAEKLLHIFTSEGTRRTESIFHWILFKEHQRKVGRRYSGETLKAMVHKTGDFLVFFKMVHRFLSFHLSLRELSPLFIFREFRGSTPHPGIDLLARAEQFGLPDFLHYFKEELRLESFTQRL